MVKSKPKKPVSKPESNPTLKYAIMDSTQKINRKLFKEKKVDFFVTCCHCCACEGTFLYFLSSESAVMIGGLLDWRDFSECKNRKYFCIHVESAPNMVLQEIAEKADLQEVN